MNIKIKATGIACLLGDDYDRVFTALSKKLGDSPNNMFSERIAGHEYLQWVLPGDGWVALAQGDPIIATQVKNELKERQQTVISMFGANALMADRVLTVPDDEYIYYKVDSNGKTTIKLTAWGYRYPERIDGGNASGTVTPTTPTENVSIRLTYNGVPMRNQEFKLNGLKRTTDEKGNFTIGDLPIGYEFDIEQGRFKRHYMVTSGETMVELSCTEYANIDISVKKDGNPATDIVATINYDGVTHNVTTDELGHAQVKLPLSLTGAACAVTVDGETQQQTLSQSLNTFDFSLVTPDIINGDNNDNDDSKDLDDDNNNNIDIAEDNNRNDDNSGDIAGDSDVDDNGDDNNDDNNDDNGDENNEVKEISENKKKDTSIWTAIFLIIILIILTILTYYFGKALLF